MEDNPGRAPTTGCNICGAAVSASQASTRFAGETVEYGITLCRAHRSELSEALSPFVSAGRRIGRSRTLVAVSS